jgi:hypothetical protein
VTELPGLIVPRLQVTLVSSVGVQDHPCVEE